MLFIEADFADEKAGVEDHSGYDCGEEDNAKNYFQIVAPVEDDPATAYGKREPGQADSQAQKEQCRLAAGYAHVRILPRLLLDTVADKNKVFFACSADFLCELCGLRVFLVPARKM